MKPYACGECDRSFTQRCSLESHCRKVHSMDISYAYKQRRNKIYVCEECGHSTADASKHFLHLRENHPNNPALMKCHDRRQFKFNGGETTTQQSVHLPRTWQGKKDLLLTYVVTLPTRLPSEKHFNLYWMSWLSLFFFLLSSHTREICTVLVCTVLIAWSRDYNESSCLFHVL